MPFKHNPPIHHILTLRDPNNDLPFHNIPKLQFLLNEPNNRHKKATKEQFPSLAQHRHISSPIILLSIFIRNFRNYYCNLLLQLECFQFVYFVYYVLWVTSWLQSADACTYCVYRSYLYFD